MNAALSRVVVRFDVNGDISYFADGLPVELLIIDERAPNDRVYRYSTHMVNSCVIDALIGADRVHYLGDKPVTEAAIRAALDGRPPPPRPALTLVKSGPEGGS
ncbi:hypothetical protein [Bradyrhizobium sp. USDA 3458]|uniref:hypothetical protein n=1 Tax=Bradyrhizobium sp. USDA 3458 TaxID=2591461 RepID=UPI001143F95F|nr:hypothetical protein [Bradyrhizobium sp. USDA 3458]